MAHRRRRSRELPPIFLGEVRQTGIHLIVRCPLCARETTVDPVELPYPDEIDVQQLARVYKCLVCMRHGGMGVAPHHRRWVAYLRVSGQRHRLPFYAPMMLEDDDGEWWP